MNGNNTLSDLMQSEVKPFRPWLYEVELIHTIINREVFDNVLNLPKFKLIRKTDIGNDFGWCEGEHDFETFKPESGQSLCTIGLLNTWKSVQSFVIILAHEMVHQWQWDIYSLERFRDNKSLILSHGPSFWQFRTTLANFSIPLKTTYPTDL